MVPGASSHILVEKANRVSQSLVFHKARLFNESPCSWCLESEDGGEMSRNNRRRWIAPWKNSLVKPEIYHACGRVVGRSFLLGECFTKPGFLTNLLAVGVWKVKMGAR